MKWVIYDKSEDNSIEKRLGSKDDKYEAYSLKEDGNDAYTASFSMKNVNHDEDFDKVITFRADVILFLT